MGNLFLAFIIFLSRVFFLSPLPIYFDGPEYIRLINNPNLFQALILGHEPIHPGYILFSWLMYHLFPFLGPVYSAELVSSIFETLLLFTFYKITKLIFNNNTAFKALIIASLLPALFLAGVNVLTDTTYIFFYLFSFYCLLRFLKGKNKKWFIVGVLSMSYSIFTHTQVIIWLPVFLAPVLIYNKRKHTLHKLAIFVFLGVLTGVGLLVALLAIAGNTPAESVYLLFGHGGDLIISQSFIHEIGVYTRNLGITLIRNNSSLVIVTAIIGSVLFYGKDKKRLYMLLLWLFPVLLTSQYWHIGLFGRVSLIASFPLAVLSAQVKSRIIFTFLVVSLLAILIPLALANKNAIVQKELEALYKSIPKNSILISSNLIRPQVSYSGTIYFINEPGSDMQFIERKISTALKRREKVYIDSQALFNPYYSLDGNNLHILSLGKIGHSEIVPLFKEYNIKIVKIIDPSRRVFLYQVNGKLLGSNSVTIGKAKPGTEVFLYSNSFENRVNLLRFDYHDLSTWVWELIFGKSDPVLWTIADKSGTYQLPNL